MKKSLLVLFISFFFSGIIFAQDDGESIIDDLNKPKKGQGEVTIYQDESILDIVAIRQDGDLESSANSSLSTYKGRVYRIQVFSGNKQTKSKEEAYYKQAQIKEIFPEISSSVTYDAPVWRLRVGSFQIKEEAEAALKDLKANFPAFGREMYVIGPVKK